jgi:predicted MFS family arabinose efflux permease
MRLRGRPFNAAGRGGGGRSQVLAGGRSQVLAGFIALGIFWGAWGAALPGVQRRAGVSNGQLGVTLLLIGAGALISMRATGYVIDRRGREPTAWTVAALGLCGILPGLARSFWELALALLVLGAASGATDVAINAGGVRVEDLTGRPLLNLAHASFSGAVVVASLSVGGLRAIGLGTAGTLLLAGIVVLSIAAGLAASARDDRTTPRPERARDDRATPRPERAGPQLHERAGPHPHKRGWGLRPPGWLMLLGAMAALAYWVESAWQNWSGVHLAHDLAASAGVSALGPAAFASAAAAGRLAGQRLIKRHSDRTLIAAGAAIAAAGTAVAATATAVPTGIAGILLAGAGTSVCAPTIFSLAGAAAGPELRGAAISTATTIAYLGFLIGPAAVGAVAALSSLRSSLAAVGGLAVALALIAALGPLPKRRQAQRSRTTTIPASRSGTL